MPVPTNGGWAQISLPRFLYGDTMIVRWVKTDVGVLRDYAC